MTAFLALLITVAVLALGAGTAFVWLVHRGHLEVRFRRRADPRPQQPAAAPSKM